MQDNKSTITEGLITDWLSLKERADKLEGQIVDRLDYIVETVFKTFNAKLTTWYFSDATEGQMGHFTWDKPEIYIVWEAKTHKDMIIIDRNGEEHMFDSAVPTRWLFEEFETELVEGKRKYEEQESAKIAKTLGKKEAAKKLAAAARSKLTKEELAALKQVL